MKHHLETFEGGHAEMLKQRRAHKSDVMETIETILEEYKGSNLALIVQDGEDQRTFLGGCGDVEESLLLAFALDQASKKMLDILKDSISDKQLKRAIKDIQSQLDED